MRAAVRRMLADQEGFGRGPGAGSEIPWGKLILTAKMRFVTYGVVNVRGFFSLPTKRKTIPVDSRKLSCLLFRKLVWR